MISEDAIRHVANLARMALSEDEVKTYSKQLGAILEHFKQLEELDTQKVEPLVTPTDVEPHFREDVAEKGMGAEAIVSNAPEKSGNLFKVPAVL